MPHTTHDAVRIYWEEAGRPEGLRDEPDTRQPLLLIMGLGATLEWWQRLTPSLARHRTILFDNRGAGKSDVPPGPYSISVMADDAAAVLDAAGVRSAHVVGLSMGGFIAQELALQHPDRVRSLVLGCTSCGGQASVRAEAAAVSALGARAKMTREEAAWEMVPYTFDATTPRERIAEDLAVRLASTMTNDGYFAQLGAVRSWRGSHDRLSGITMPTLVMHGETDRLVPPENARILAGGLPNATLVTLPNASHIFLTDQLEPARDAMLSFLDRAAADTAV